MNRYSPSYILSQSFHGFSRNGFMSLASILILTSCLLITGCFGLLIYNLYVNLNALDELNEIVCVVNYDVDEQTALSLKSKIENLDNVANVVFVSKEEAIEQMRENYSAYPSVLTWMENENWNGENNPLPYVYKVTYIDSEKVPSLTYELQSMDEFKNVDDRISLTNTLENLRTTVLFVFIGFLVILLFISVIIIMNTVRMAISSRSKEITVMRYIGATKFFISLPFILESFIIGLISAAVAFAIQYGIYAYIFQKISTDPDINSLITVAPFSGLWYYVLAAFVAVSLLTCYIGSKISLIEHVKV